VSAKRLLFRALARAEFREIGLHYEETAGEATALRWNIEVERILDLVCSQPGIGTLRLAQELDITGLRSVSVRRFPYLIGYLDHEDHIEVWRIVHERRSWDAWQGES
jgi:toxin ParE1/3/4